MILNGHMISTANDRTKFQIIVIFQILISQIGKCMEYLRLEALHDEVNFIITHIFNIKKMSHKILSDLLILTYQ